MSAPHYLSALTPLSPEASVSPDTVLFESRGAVLIRADDAQIVDVVEKVLLDHRTTVFAPGIEKVGFKTRVNKVGARVVALRGHLGAFHAEVEAPTGNVNADRFSPNQDGSFDLVLDLGRERLCTVDVAPLGYFAPGTDRAAIQPAIAAMRALAGRFVKPRYFKYQPDLCAHGASGVAGCTRCLDVCAADAIVSAGSQIRVDPYLCQGCASCTLACPSGALSFNNPSSLALENQLRETLRGVPAETALIIHAGVLAREVQEALAHSGAMSMRVDPLPAFGDELWLRAFGLGAQDLVLVDSGSTSEKSRLAIAARVAQVQAMLPALGIAQERLVWLPQAALSEWLAAYSRSSSAVAFASLEASDAPSELTDATQPTAVTLRSRTKRMAWLEALRLGGLAASESAPVEIPAGAPFGDVRVNERTCTLCFACTQLCPTGALAADRSTTLRLLFRESACIQCDLCMQGCPEKAVTLRARFAPATLVAQRSVVLHQDEQLRCKSCNTPFISRRLLESSLQRLKDNPSLTAGGREALMTCPACRQRTMLNL